MRYYFLLFFFFAFYGLWGQSISIKDEQSQTPLSDVYVSNGEVADLSDVNGRVPTERFQPQDSLFFELAGYQTVSARLSDIAQKGYVVFLQSTKRDSFKTFDMKAITVPGSRQLIRLGDMPMKIVSIDPNKEARLLNPQTTADLLESSGLVYVQKSQLGGGSPMIRGFAANRVLLAVDGVRMNNAIFREGNLQNVISVDAHSLKGATILFGPSSVMYGSDALGGVMDFRTLSPILSPNKKAFIHGDAKIRYARASNEKTAHGSLGIGGKKWAWLGSVSVSDFDDMRMGVHGPASYLRNQYVETGVNGDTVVNNPDPSVQRFSGYSQLNLMQKLRFRPNKSWDMTYAFHHARSSDIPRYDRLVQVRDNRLRFAEWKYGPQRWTMHHLHVDKSDGVGTLGRMRLNIAFQQFEESRIDRGFGSDTRRTRTEQVDAFSVNLDMEKEFNKKLKVLYGLEGVHNTVRSAGFETILTTEAQSPIASRYPDGSTWQSYAAYTQAQWKPKPTLTITAGVRYNQILIDAQLDSTFFPFDFTQIDLNKGALSGGLGGAWEIADALQVNANVAVGFRAPNIDDIAKVFDSEPGNVVVPNPDLGAEFAYNFELGFAKNMDLQGNPRGKGTWERLQFSVTGFYTLLDNAMIRRPFTLNGRDSILYDGVFSQVEALVNADGAWIAGVQGSASYRLFQNLTLSSHFTYISGEANDGEPLRHVTPAYGRSAITWSSKDFNIQAYSVYNLTLPADRLSPSERDKPFLYAENAEGLPFSPGWATFHISAGWQATQQLQLQLSAENLTNQRYRTYSSGIAGPGFQLVGSVHVHF